MLIYTGTEKYLDDHFFEQDEEGEWSRGVGMGWAHRVDKKTKEIKFVDEEHAAYRDNYSKIGGLKQLVKDLIDAGFVEEK